MKKLFVLAIMTLAACGQGEKHEQETTTDTLLPATGPIAAGPSNTKEIEPADTNTADKKAYSNLRFKDVQVTKTTPGEFLITGKGQIFEASFGWVIEDGHDELMQGHEITDAGAPEWGNFHFTVKVAPKRQNTTLHLILFELSAKDGTRQHELSIPLP